MNEVPIFIGIAVAIAIGIFNLVIKVNEKMGNKKTDSKYPCAEHAERLREIKGDHEILEKNFNSVCLVFTQKLTRLETLVETIDGKIDKFNNGRG
uniref:Uncharacterized protein n=1 Tax=viral metagenome TaxID=1070528 RepID=A0A6M3J0F2_9ZZZZ